MQDPRTLSSSTLGVSTGAWRWAALGFGLLALATAIVALIYPDKAGFAGYALLGGIGAVAAVGEIEGRPVKTFFVRKQPKAHGTRDLIEGLGPNETLRGRRVVVADDVATSGASIWRAIEAAKGAGAEVESALVLVNREEGAAEFLADHGVRLLSVFRAGQFA